LPDITACHGHALLSVDFSATQREREREREKYARTREQRTRVSRSAWISAACMRACIRAATMRMRNHRAADVRSLCFPIAFSSTIRNRCAHTHTCVYACRDSLATNRNDLADVAALRARDFLRFLHLRYVSLRSPPPLSLSLSLERDPFIRASRVCRISSIPEKTRASR